MNDLLESYGLEGMAMPYTMEQYERDVEERILAKLPADRLLARVSVAERLEGIPPEQRLEGIPPEQRLEGIPPEQRLEGIPPEKRLEGLSVEEIEVYLRKLKASGEFSATDTKK